MKRILISLIVGIVILVVLFLNMDVHDLSRRIMTASPILVLVSFTVFLCFNTLKPIRWRIIVGKGHFKNFFSIVQIGNLITIILPSQLQEPIRAVLLKEKEKINFGYAMSSIFVERLMDVTGLLFIGVIAALFFPTTGNIQSWIFHIMSDIIISASLLIGFLIFLALKPKLFSLIFSPLKKIRHLTKLYEKFEFLILELSIGFKEMTKKPIILIESFLITVLMWMINFVTVYILFVSLGLQINPLIILFGFVGTTLGMALPQSPGYVGTFEAIWLGAFSMLGYGEHNSEILAVGVLYHLLLLVNNSSLGIIGLVVLRLSIKDILFSHKKKS